MNALGKAFSCFKPAALLNEEGEAIPDDVFSLEINVGLNEIDSPRFGGKVPDVPPPLYIPKPPPRPPATPASLQTDLTAELCYWSTKYEHDETFRAKIDAYCEFRKEVMAFKNTGVTSEDPDKDPLEPLYRKLGSMLAEAFGMVDPETNDWTQAVKDAAKEGGKEYARPSVTSFMWTQTPTILKSTVNLYARIFFGEAVASTLRTATNFVYPFVQLPVSIWAAQNNASEQSIGVQLQKRELPEWSPNVESSKVTNENGTPGELRPMRDVLVDLAELKEVDALIKELDPIKLAQKRGQLARQRLGATVKLLDQLKLVTEALKESQKSDKAPPLNDIEKKILNWMEGENFTLEERIDELSQVTAGRAALSGLDRLQAKRLLRQLEDWKMLDEELKNAFEAVEAGVPYKSTAVREAVINTDFERAQVACYVKLNVFSNQAVVRDIRTAFYAGATVTQVSLQLAEHLYGYEGTVAGDALQVITSLVQTLYYAWKYPEATGKDALNKFATQWQIIAMTGAGNLFDKEGKFDKKKLDKMVTGKMSLRLLAFEGAAKADLATYQQAVFGWLVDSETLDDDEAVKVEFGGKMIPCTYAALADRFADFKDTNPDKEKARENDRAARRAFVKAIAAQRVSGEVQEKILRNLDLYEETVTNLGYKSTPSKLLDDDSTLPLATRNMLSGALKQVSGEPSRENDEFDRELFKLAGKVEQRNELPSQAAQKLGQAFAWFVAGTSGFLALKSVFALGVQALVTAGDLTEGGAERLATLIIGGKVGGNAFALAGLVLQLGFNHGYQDYIAKKALLRQNAGGGVSIVNAPPPSLRGSLWQEFLVSVGFPDARVEVVTGYETLVGKAIPKEDWPPKLKFERKARLTEAMADQMFAMDIWSWHNYFKAEHGTLENMTPDELNKAIERDLDAIRPLLQSTEVTAPAPAKNDDSDSDEVRIRIDPDIPSLDLRQVTSVGNTGSAPNEEQKPLSPRSFARKRMTELTAAAKRRQVHAKPHTGGGASRKGHDPDRTGNPEDVGHINNDPEEYGNQARVRGGRSNQAASTQKSSDLMGTLPWERSEQLGGYVAKTAENVFYLTPEPSQHASPIQAFSVPGEDGEGVLHISDYRYPSLGVSNMLQSSLGGRTNLRTLSTADEFALFCYQNLPHQKDRLETMPMEDLAAFTRHQALNDPDAGWMPMTTAKVRYVPEAEDQIQPVGTQPPALQQGKSFGVSYEAQDALGVTLRGSVMLSYQAGQYSLIDPQSNQGFIDSKFDEPQDALAWFMRTTRSKHPNFQDMTFTLMYHVPPETVSNEVPARNDVVRAGVEAARWNQETLERNWFNDTRSYPKARQQLAADCQGLEAENSRLLQLKASDYDTKARIASRVKVNLDCIRLLGRAYAKMTVEEFEFNKVFED